MCFFFFILENDETALCLKKDTEIWIQKILRQNCKYVSNH